MKDPAFLFYSKDFYEGTRTMLPEERACYIDLLIYQHQNGIIPENIDRLLMYCSGVNKATLKATLEAKFERVDKGWLNNKLQRTINERENFKSKLSISGVIGQFWKKSKALLNSQEYRKIREYYSNTSNEELFETINKIDLKDEGSLEGWLKALLKHIANAIGNEIEIKVDSFDFKKSLFELIKDRQLCDDWLKVRKNKKATNTITAFESIVNEISKSGLSAEECIRISVENSWSGFKSSWLNKVEDNTKPKKYNYDGILNK